MDHSVDHATDEIVGTATQGQQISPRRAAERHQEALPFGEQKEKVKLLTTQLSSYNP
jgi:hypothetical protein